MDREERWKAQAEATAALGVAIAEWMAGATPQTLAAVEEASRKYTISLARVVGLQVAQSLAEALGAFQRATERLDALKATLSAAPSVDAADREFLQQVAADQVEAERAYKVVGAATLEALERARARDNEPDDKGRS